MNNSSLKSAFLGLTCFIATACSVGPDFEAPQMDLPSNWTNELNAKSQNPDVAQLGSWWKLFGDEQLNALIDRAVKSNLDYAQAKTQIRQARAAVIEQRADFFPSLSASSNYERIEDSPSADGNYYQGGFDSSWEIDIFGGNRRAVESTLATYDASLENERDVYVSLISEVASGYISLRALQKRLTVTEENLKTQLASLDIIKKKYEAGFSDILDVSSAEAEVASTSAQLPSLKSQIKQQLYALALLLALPPNSLSEELAEVKPVPVVTNVIPASIPSELLQKRPDIRKAEAIYRAATAEVGVATADLFPKFTISGGLSTEGNKFREVFDLSGHVWRFGGGMTAPIFEAGRLRANLDAKEAAQEEAFLQYQKAVYSALQEVESAMTAFNEELERKTALTAAVDANQRALFAASRLYSEGVTDYLNLLVAQRSLLNAQDSLVQSEQNIALDLVSLYKALGGGWESVQAPSK